MIKAEELAEKTKADMAKLIDDIKEKVIEDIVENLAIEVYSTTDYDGKKIGVTVSYKDKEISDSEAYCD